MSKLEDIVPPPELCKMIPVRAFQNSALVWNFRYGTRKGDRIVDLIERDKYNGGGFICPAPTPEEIMDGLLLKTSDCEPRLYWQGGWHVQCAGKEEYDMSSAAAAALKLWLESKGDASHE